MKDASENSVENLFKRFKEEDLKWKKKHPFRAYTRDWLDKRFPNGIAGGYRAYHIIFSKPWKIFDYWGDQTKWALQRVSRGWDDRATWSIDYHLSKLIPEMIKELKRVSVGVPIGMFDGMEEIKLPNGVLSYSDEDTKIATERWNKILDDLIDGFEEYNKIDDLDTYEEQELAYTKFFTVTFELFKKHYRDLWW